MIGMTANWTLATSTTLRTGSFARRHMHAFLQAKLIDMAAPSQSTKANPWHAAYPSPSCAEVGKITRQEMLSLLKNSEKAAGKDFVLVDLRRNDHEGGTIRGSINLPAQSLYPSIPTLHTALQAARVPLVIWYCSSSQGRGARAAGWFMDYITKHGEGHVMESLILFEGIKGWAQAGGEYLEWMDEYDADAWAKGSNK